ncbi:nmrA-like family domain-containing protein 1 [Ochotona curzoniae]|uniref:nmrA-like family domain-containing protein 1 n=1 Tax=Ochotona curzoniae TaxID=130825 RepID=UPI001B34BFD4|nr:nmrA-like family domain-containing protein 1 [Ochotona curzoniae]XP_040858806.1 nmrA-like family domain-containing protein 1 [Ochotona curzoniae]
MASKKVIAVFGATGAQGGPVVRALLDAKHFAVRALTRDVTKPSALALKDLGAEVVKCDLDDEASLVAALKGVYGAFLVTNFWEYLDQEREVRQGKLMADVAKRLGLKHVVFSSLEYIHKLSGGKLTVPHFDGKGIMEEYFRSIGVPMTSVRVPSYFENFHGGLKPAKASDGDYYTLALPMGDKPLPGISVADIGVIVSNIFNSPEEFIGKAMNLGAEALTMQQYAEILSKGLGKDIRDSKITPEAYEKLNIPQAKGIANMCRYWQKNPERDVELTYRLNPKVRSFQQFVSESVKAFKDI